LPDKRKKKQIPLPQILKLLVSMSALGIKSLLLIDKKARDNWAKNMSNTIRKMVASDSTILRTLSWLDNSSLKYINFSCYKNTSVQNRLGLTLPSQKKVSVGAIDGSGFGKILASVFMVLGDDFNFLLDAKLCPKYGKELPTSTSLLNELVKKLGKGFVDYLLFDGLYFSQNFFNACINAAMKPVIKTTETGLNVIQEAEELFSTGIHNKEIEHSKGLDINRNCEFEAWAVSGIHMEGVEPGLKVVKVMETRLKGKRAGETEIFFVITNASELSAADLRMLAHSRWHIENNGFKSFNEQCRSKRLFSKDPQARFNLLLVQLLSFNIIQLFRLTCEEDQLKKIKYIFALSFSDLRSFFWQSLDRIFLAG